MANNERRYTGAQIDVRYDTKKCIHAAECVRGLPAVFDTNARPWIQPDNADADAVAAVIARCPSGALHFERKDSGAAEPTPTENRVAPQQDGPLYVHGDIHVQDANGNEVLHDTRMALCRCGLSSNKPFCDNSHKNGQFRADTTFTARPLGQPDGATSLTIRPKPNGPLALQGLFTLEDGQGTTLEGHACSLCRCGGSHTKPFCDGTHAKIGFKSEESPNE